MSLVHQHCAIFYRALQHVYLHGTLSQPPCRCSCFPLPHLQFSFLSLAPPSVSFLLSPTSSSSSTLPAFSADLLKVFPWNGGENGARSNQVFLVVLTFPVHLICIQYPTSAHLYLSGSLDALRSDRTHCRFGSLQPDEFYVNGSIIIFVDGLFSTLNLSSLDPYSDYMSINILVNDFYFFLKHLSSIYSLFGR